MGHSDGSMDSNISFCYCLIEHFYDDKIPSDNSKIFPFDSMDLSYYALCSTVHDPNRDSSHWNARL